MKNILQLICEQLYVRQSSSYLFEGCRSLSYSMACLKYGTTEESSLVKFLVVPMGEESKYQNGKESIPYFILVIHYYFTYYNTISLKK